MPFSLPPPYPSTSPPTPKQKGKKEGEKEKETKDALLMLVRLLQNKHYEKGSNTHTGTFLDDGIALHMGQMRNL